MQRPCVTNPRNDRLSAKNQTFAPTSPARLATRETTKPARRSKCALARIADCTARPTTTPGPTNPHQAAGKLPGSLARGAKPVFTRAGEPTTFPGFRHDEGARFKTPA